MDAARVTNPAQNLLMNLGKFKNIPIQNLFSKTRRKEYIQKQEQASSKKTQIEKLNPRDKAKTLAFNSSIAMGNASVYAQYLSSLLIAVSAIFNTVNPEMVKPGVNGQEDIKYREKIEVLNAGKIGNLELKATNEDVENAYKYLLAASCILIFPSRMANALLKKNLKLGVSAAGWAAMAPLFPINLTWALAGMGVNSIFENLGFSESNKDYSGNGKMEMDLSQLIEIGRVGGLIFFPNAVIALNAAGCGQSFLENIAIYRMGKVQENKTNQDSMNFTIIAEIAGKSLLLTPLGPIGLFLLNLSDIVWDQVQMNLATEAFQQHLEESAK